MKIEVHNKKEISVGGYIGCGRKHAKCSLPTQFVIWGGVFLNRAEGSSMPERHVIGAAVGRHRDSVWTADIGSDDSRRDLLLDSRARWSKACPNDLIARLADEIHDVLIFGGVKTDWKDKCKKGECTTPPSEEKHD